MVRVSEELNFLFYLILVNYNVNSFVAGGYSVGQANSYTCFGTNS